LNFFFRTLRYSFFKFLDYEIPCVRDEVPTIFEQMLFEREDVYAASLIYSRLYVRVDFIRSDNGYITYDMRSVVHTSCLHLFIFLDKYRFETLLIRIVFVDNDHRCHKKKISFASYGNVVLRGIIAGTIRLKRYAAFRQHKNLKNPVEIHTQIGPNFFLMKKFILSLKSF